MYLGGHRRVLLGFNSPLSLILLHPVDDRDRTRKGIKFWMERLIINSSGELGLRGTRFQDTGYREPQRAWSKFGSYFLDTRENNRMGKTRDLFKKIRDTKGTFHAKMASIKDRNGMDLTEQKILRRGGKNTQKNCTKKIFMTQIIMMV